VTLAREPQPADFVDPKVGCCGEAAMPGDENKRTLNRELLLASALVAAGLVISALSLAQIRANGRQLTAQATPPLQGVPAADPDKQPAESKPGGERPTTPAPEPARPDPQTQGIAKPALPPAPAEKVAPPIKDK
jgi:outer membrane biosynthesis protein TonB